MENYAKYIKASMAAIGAAITAAVGWMGWLIIALVGMMTLDFFTGWGAARHRGEWHSTIAKKGLSKKVGVLAIVVTAAVLDWLISGILTNVEFISLPFEYTTLLAPIVACWFILAEIGSIIENAVCLGASCPKFVQNLIEVLKSTIEKTGDKLTTGEKDQE